MSIVSWLLAALLLCDLCVDTSLGIRVYKSRKTALAMLGAEETQQFFGSCEQSSNEESCQMAMDDVVTSAWTQCASTEPEKGSLSWWRGYLEYPIYVATVYIQNADWNYVGERDGTQEFTISGNGDVCYTHSENGTSFSSRSFPCDILADDIEIKTLIEGAVIALGEVQVYGARLMIPNVMNARGQVVAFSDCTQSSTALSRHCWYAYDKKVNRKPDTFGCAMSDAERTEWWRGEFIIPAIVQQVILYNRDDCCGTPKKACCKMNNFEVTVGARRCARYNSASGFDSKSFTCNQFGGDVKIQVMTSDEMVLCEIEVYGFLVIMTSDQRRNEIGCFVDRQEDPDLGDFSEPVSITNVNVEKCDRMCRRLKKKYFGLQEGSQCWCGSSYGKYGKVADTECEMQCEGKRGESLCGNVNRTRVYELF